MQILFDQRWDGPHGIGRFSFEFQKRTTHNIIHLPITSKPATISGILELTRKLGEINTKTPFFSPGYLPPLLKQKRPIALTIHDLNHIDTPYNSNIAKRFYYNRILKDSCRKADLILTVSNFSKERILDWLSIPEERVTVVGNGISSSFTPIGEKLILEKPYFFCVSNRRGHKNESQALKAFSVSKASLNHLFLLTGDSNKQLLAEIEKLGLSHSVKFLGKLSDSELACAYRGAKALIFPSLYEGFGLPIVEAIFCRTLVVASNIAVIREVSGSNFVPFDPKSHESISCAIDLADEIQPIRKQHLLDAAFQHANDNYSWEKTASKIDSAIRERLA